MSHEATNWAIKQRGLPPSAKIVLWHLCDRYHPDHGCFPSLETLAFDCEISRRSVQDQIKKLEEFGLIVVKKKARSGGLLPLNSYHFNFNNLGQNLPWAKSALGKEALKPWANERENLGQNLPTNPVIEPVIEPVTKKHTKKPNQTPFGGVTCKDKPVKEPGQNKKTDNVNRVNGSKADIFFDTFWKVYPRKVAKAEAKKRFLVQSKKNDPSKIIEGAKRYANICKVKGTSEEYIAHASTWLNGQRWADGESQGVAAKKYAHMSHTKSAPITVPFKSSGAN